MILLLIALAGVINPNVSQANIHRTICRSGWTARIRPTMYYTNRIKREQMAALGLPGTSRDYTEDHIVPLEVGGHPSDPRNLVPQPKAEARLKDRRENSAHRAVCNGSVTLRDAQAEFMK